MSVAELQELEEIKGLMNRGQQLGVLTYAEIAGAVSELDLDEADVEELHGFLERAEIELVEELDPALAAAEVERAPDKRGRRKPKTALDLKRADAKQVRSRMTVVGERIVRELNGISCLPLELVAASQKGITVSRSFGQLLSEKEPIQQALLRFVARAGEKLRREGGTGKNLA